MHIFAYKQGLLLEVEYKMDYSAYLSKYCYNLLLDSVFKIKNKLEELSKVD